MEIIYAEEFELMLDYADQHGFELTRRLGSGQDGLVYATSNDSAIKLLFHQQRFDREYSVYLRLLENKISKVGRFAVPQLVNADLSRRILEMQIVTPPFVVDFASASLDERPILFREFTQEQLDEWEADRRELFGDDWKEVQTVMNLFERHGIFLSDVKPGNVTFR